MLLQLEVEDDLLEILVEQSALVLANDLENLVPRQLTVLVLAHLPLVQLLDQLVV